MLNDSDAEGKPYDMGHAIRYIYFSGQAAAVPNRIHLQLALATVRRCYLPTDAHDTFALLAALNLLNTVIKQPWGSQLVTYGYIKTIVALLFDYLMAYPMPDESVYHDARAHVTYFRVMGVQFSFHYAIFERVPHSRGTRQVWDGLRLQLIAVEVLGVALSQLRPRPCIPAKAAPSLPDVRSQTPNLGPAKRPRITSVQLVGRARPVPKRPPQPHYRWTGIRRFREVKTASLAKALRFNLWRRQQCILYRRRDHRPLRVIRYTGRNADEVNKFLINGHPLIPPRSVKSFFPGMHYTLSPQMRIVVVKNEDYIRLLSWHNYLVHRKSHRNLLLTYGLALYLTQRLPTLRFVCTLIANRVAIRNRIFTHAALKRVPENSRMRRLKVWLPYDPQGELRSINPQELPRDLVDEYMTCEEYYCDYEITNHHGLKGLYAYRRHHLLPPIYRKIEVRNFHAYVQRQDGLWAIYSLLQEEFVSNFIYDSIWYDPRQCIIYGSIGPMQTVIYSFF